jgi:hypothetical protein
MTGGIGGRLLIDFSIDKEAAAPHTSGCKTLQAASLIRWAGCFGPQLSLKPPDIRLGDI